MGWTWRSSRELLLQYPELANIQGLMERWPALSDLTTQLRNSGELPNPPNPTGGNPGDSQNSPTN